MDTAHYILGTIIKRQGEDGARALKDDFYERYPGYLEMSRTLLFDDFVREIETSEGAFQHRITTKGLAFYSLLDSVLLPLEDMEKLSEDNLVALRESQARKVLSALVSGG